jgi:stage V sporulation protein B
MLNAIVSVLAAYLMVRSFTDVSTVALKLQRASRGAMGSALGTGAGVAIGLLFCIVLYLMYRPKVKRQMRRDRTEHVESYGNIFKILILTITPVIFSTAIYNCSASINQSFFYQIMGFRGFDEITMVTLYGIYGTQFNVLINVPISMASALSSAIVPDISGKYAIGDQEGLAESIESAIKLNMIVMIPCAVGLTALANPIIQLLFPGSSATASHLLMAGAITVAFSGLSTLSNGILQGLGKMSLPVRHAIIAIILQEIVMVPLLFFTDFGIYALVVAMIVFSLTMCILNARAIKKYAGYQQEFVKTFIRPLIASLFMGAAAWITYQGVHMVAKYIGNYLGNAVSVMFAVLVAVLVYMVAVVKTKAVTEEEMMAMPKGYLLVRLCKKMHLL